MKLAVFGTMWNEEVMMYYYRGFNQWAQETNGIVDLFLCYGRTDMDNPYNLGEYAMFEYPDLSQYDGVVMIASNINEESVRNRLVERIREAKIPCVTMDGEVEGFSKIYIDQQDAICQMVKHLYEKHQVQSVAYVGGLSSNVEASFRLAGYYEGMKACGLTVQPEWVFEKSFCYNDGIDVAEELLQRGEDLPDAIVCANDDMAAGVCEALRQAGVEVGTECLVTGFDQYFLGDHYAPVLTTVRRPRESIAYHACQMLENYNGPYELKEQAHIFFGQTCGCGSAICKNDVNFRRYVFDTYNNRDVLSAMLAHIEESMIAGEEISAIAKHMEKVFSRFKEGRCRIMLQPDLENHPKSSYDSYRSCTKEYALWNCDKSQDKHATVEGHAYIYAPIHFLDHLYGFCVFRDIPQLMNNKELYNFAKSLGFSIENMIQKNKYTFLNDKLQGLYETDYLTGAYNRHGFAKYANEMLYRSRTNEDTLQVVFVDIDGLKIINDKYGHEAGDVVIQIVGRAVREHLDDKSKVFRYGGDEFLVLHEGDASFEEFCAMVEKTMKEKQEMMHLPYEVSASMGCVVAIPGEQKTLEDYVKEADHLMYRIKQEHHQKQKYNI